MCELTVQHGMGAALARHAMCESALNIKELVLLGYYVASSDNFVNIKPSLSA
jgi:hypothetical protein